MVNIVRQEEAQDSKTVQIYLQTMTVITLVTGFLLRSLKYAAEDKKNIFLILFLKIFYVMWHSTYTYACLNFPT